MFTLRKMAVDLREMVFIFGLKMQMISMMIIVA